MGGLRARVTAFGKTHFGSTTASTSEAPPAGLLATDLYLAVAQAVAVSLALQAGPDSMGQHKCLASQGP